MPIRSQETDLYPLDLFERAEMSDDDSLRWWAMYTRSRREKELMRRLEKQQIGFYGPTIVKHYRSPAGRLRTSYIPLFSNYVFIFGSDRDRQTVLESGCISRTIEVTEPLQLITDLRQLQTVITAGVDLTPEGRLEVGTLVKVRSGPMEGVIGTIVERRGRKRLLVAVNFLQQGASVELNDVDVERYDD